MAIVAAFAVPHPPLAVPEVGRGKEAGISSTIRSFERVAEHIAALHPETIVMLSPHATAYADYIHVSPGAQARGDLKRFGAAEVTRVQYDETLTGKLEALCMERGFPAGTTGEREPALDHGVLVPLYYINRAYTDYKLVRIGLSGLSRAEHYRFGMLLKEAVESLGRRAVIVASGDLSHKLLASGPYGFAPEGPVLDAAITGILQSGEFGEFFTIDDALSQKGADCGLLSFIMMAGALDRCAIKPELLSYEGPFGVGYGVASFIVEGPDESRGFLARKSAAQEMSIEARRTGEDALVRLARETLEGYVRTGSIPALPDQLPSDITNARAGVFVSIKKGGHLRGCIGTIAPAYESIAQEIRMNAVSAGTKDPRFDPVRVDELEALVYSVDVLLPPEPAERGELDPKRYGVIVKYGHRRGLLLPNLEGVDTVDEQISIALQKAGIHAHEPYSLERFEVVRHL